jgi:5-methyltetrahydropteroyltriglutamate--homocysteine methyltransferase
MIPYPPYATTVIGAYSVPDWYEALDRLIALGQLSMAALMDGQFRAGEAAIHDQELAAIDVITGGEMHRRTHNRHSPPNAMLNYFWSKIPAFQGATRPKPVTPHDPNVFHPAATCVAAIGESIDLGLVEEFQMVSALTRRPVKITMTSPYFLAKVAFDEHYNDLPRMVFDLAKLLRFNFRRLAAHGCKHIQIDEPFFTLASEEEAQLAVDAINLAIAELPPDIHVSVHVCQGNYAVGREYDSQIGHRYFDVGRYKADAICKIACSSYLIEHDMTPHFRGLLRNQQLGVGAIDVQDPRVESAEMVVARIRAHGWLAPEQTIITSSCGFNHLPRHIAFGKLNAMAQAKRMLGG